MRVLWAEAIDDVRTAMVIDTQQGNLMGGVVYITDLEMDFGYPFSPRILDGSARMKINFMWEWCRVVDSADAFRRSREWEKHLEAPPKQIEDARTRR